MSPSLQVYSNDQILEELYHRLSVGALRLELLRVTDSRHAELRVVTSNTSTNFIVMAYEPTIKPFNSPRSVEASVPV